jgi:hypothetical protein
MRLVNHVLRAATVGYRRNARCSDKRRLLHPFGYWRLAGESLFDVAVAVPLVDGLRMFRHAAEELSLKLPKGSIGIGHLSSVELRILS